MSRFELHYGTTTDVGRVRRVNEDSFLAAPPVFVVADGMGGHAGGDVASALVVEEFAGLAGAAYDPREGADAISAALERGQRRIHEYSAHQQPAGGARWYAGTTVVVAMLVQDKGHHKWLLANLGDSRIYRLAEGALEQVSVDHSVVQELIDRGELSADEVESHPERHVVTRALGGPDLAEADYFLLPVLSVERLFLCSDGVSGMIPDGEIETILREVEDSRDAADRLVAAAVTAGGRDNATAIVVDVVGLLVDEESEHAAPQSTLETKLGARP